MWFRISIGIVIIVAIAVGGSFFTSYNNQQSEASSLESKISNDSANLKIIESKTDNLEKDLAAISRDTEDVLKAIDDEQDILPEMINSNVMLRKIFEIGDETEVIVVPLSTTDWSSLKVGKNSYQVFKTKLELTGTEDNIIYFVTEIQNDSFPTLVVEKLRLEQEKYVDENDEDNDEDYEEILERHSGEIDLAIYAK